MAGGGAKIQTPVDFPINGLDIAPFVLFNHNGEELIYDLYGVSNHFGSLGFGHYTAYAKNPLNNKWYNFDDSNCSPVNEERIISDAAYNLFYRRRGFAQIGQLNYDKVRL